MKDESNKEEEEGAEDTTETAKKEEDNKQDNEGVAEEGGKDEADAPNSMKNLINLPSGQKACQICGECR